MIKKNIILILFSLVISLFMVMSVTSVGNDMQSANITINFPVDLGYDSATGSTGLRRLNATVRWDDETKNITNVSFIFISGSTAFKFSNGTLNGTGGKGGLNGDFTYLLQGNDLTANLVYTIVVEIRNSTEDNEVGAINSSSLTYTLDSTNPSVTLERPHNRESISPVEGIVTLEYIFTETNAGNSTLYLNGVKTKSSTSGTISSNVTSGKTNKFTRGYTADDSSESWLIEITDLAGNKVNSSAFTYSVIYSGGEIQTRTFTPSGQPIPTQAEVRNAQAQGRPFSVSPPQPTGKGFIGFLMGWWWVILIFIVVGIYIYNKNQNK